MHAIKSLTAVCWNTGMPSSTIDCGTLKDVYSNPPIPHNNTPPLGCTDLINLLYCYSTAYCYGIYTPNDYYNVGVVLITSRDVIKQSMLIYTEPSGGTNIQIFEHSFVLQNVF